MIHQAAQEAAYRGDYETAKDLLLKKEEDLSAYSDIVDKEVARNLAALEKAAIDAALTNDEVLFRQRNGLANVVQSSNTKSEKQIVRENVFTFSYTLAPAGTVIEEVIIGDNVTEIGNYAFSGCTALKYINLPSSLINISARAFESCTALEDIYLTIYDSAGKYLESNGWNQFTNECFIAYELKANEVYYLCVVSMDLIDIDLSVSVKEHKLLVISTTCCSLKNNFTNCLIFRNFNLYCILMCFFHHIFLFPSLEHSVHYFIDF